MFQTYSFEAFNMASHANIACALKYHPADSSLSSLKVQYFFGLAEKYQLVIPQNSLSYDMTFVFGNLKAFYEYLHSVHQDHKFQLCQLDKKGMKISFLLKVFNQDKTVTQEFNSTHVSDQVLWKSELNSKLQNFQSTISNRMSSEVEKKVRHYMIEENERTSLRSEALDQKVTREISLIKDKLEKVVSFINRQEIVKQKLEFNQVKYRGRYSQKNESSCQSQQEQRNGRRNTRSYEMAKRTLPIQKEEKPPKKPIQRKPIRSSRELNSITRNNRTNPNKLNRFEKLSPAIRIKEMGKQYQRQNISNIIKVYPMFQKTNNQSIKPTVKNLFIKRSRGRPSKMIGVVAARRPHQEPFIIQKSSKNDLMEDQKFQKKNAFANVRENNRKTSNQRSDSNRSLAQSKNRGSENQQKGKKEQSKGRSKQRGNANINKGAQFAKSMQQALKSYDPTTKNNQNNSNRSPRKNHLQNQKMVEESEQKIEKMSIEKKQCNNEKQKKAIFSQQNNVSELRKGHQSRHYYRKQKNTKNQITIDLENEQEYNNFFIKIKSYRSNNGEQQEKLRKFSDEMIKREEEQKDSKKPQQSQSKNFGELPRQFLSKKIAQRITSQISDRNVQFEDLNLRHQGDRSEMQSDQEIDRVNHKIQTYKRQKIEQKKQDERIIVISNENSEMKGGLNESEQKETREIPQQMSNIKFLTNPNSKASVQSLHEMVDPSKQIDISNISPAEIPAHEFLDSINHFVPDFTPNISVVKFHNTKLQNYFEFKTNPNQVITKVSKISSRGKKAYIPLVSSDPLPRTGQHFWCIRIIRSGNYHICMGIVDMPSDIKLGQIPKNCDALYVLDGGLHDEKGGNRKQNGWRVKEGDPVDVMQMELWVEKAEMYVTMIVDMDKEEMSFYYNDKFISRTGFSTWCRKNKKKLHPYLAMKTENDCIEIV